MKDMNTVNGGKVTPLDFLNIVARSIHLFWRNWGSFAAIGFTPEKCRRTKARLHSSNILSDTVSQIRRQPSRKYVVRVIEAECAGRKLTSFSKNFLPTLHHTFHQVSTKCVVILWQDFGYLLLLNSMLGEKSQYPTIWLGYMSLPVVSDWDYQKYSCKKLELFWLKFTRWVVCLSSVNCSHFLLTYVPRTTI